MRTSFILASLAALTATAAAQPAPTPVPVPAPQPQPQPYPAPAPQPATQPAPPSVPYYQQPAYQPPPVPTGPRREGFTAELNLGIGHLTITPDDADGASRTGLSGLNVGLGGWISPKTALTLRIAGTTVTENDISVTAGMLGLSAQQMVSDAAWVGGGLGIAVLSVGEEGGETLGSDRGFGLDLRAGYNFSQSARSAWSVSVELTPGFFDGGRTTGLGLQVGWQHL